MAEKKEKAKEEKVVEPEVHDEVAVPLEVEKAVIEVPTEEVLEKELPKSTFDIAGWSPKTSAGKAVKSGAITDIDAVLDNGGRILEANIVDVLIPNLESDLLMIGQSKGKFGGGQRRVFKQTQKKTMEGNKPKFSTFAVVGNNDGYVGLGYGKSKETVPAREKAIRNAKTNIFKIRRGCGSWQCNCKGPHSIPFTVKGKCGSVVITLIPAPKGKGLCIGTECAKMLKFAGIKDVWSRTEGMTVSTGNLVVACEKALKQLTKIKIGQKDVERLGIVDGKLKKKEESQNG